MLGFTLYLIHNKVDDETWKLIGSFLWKKGFQSYIEVMSHSYFYFIVRFFLGVE